MNKQKKKKNTKEGDDDDEKKAESCLKAIQKNVLQIFRGALMTNLNNLISLAFVLADWFLVISIFTNGLDLI